MPNDSAGVFRTVRGLPAAAIVAAGFCCTTPAVASATADSVDPPVATGAMVDESTVEVTLHVSVDRGGRNGDGTEARPFGTLAAAMEAASRHLARGEATRIRLGAGVYREGGLSLDLSDDRIRETLLVIEGEDAETTIISGSDVFPAGDWEDVGDGVFAHRWDQRWGHFTYRWGPPHPLGHRREMVFVDGEALRQVVIERYDFEGSQVTVDGDAEVAWTYRESLDPHRVLRPGTFGVAEREGRLYVRPVEPAAFAEATVEVAMRRVLIALEDKHNLAVRGLTFTHAANDFRDIRADGPLKLGHEARNVLIEDCRFVWNNFDGLPLPVRGGDITLRRVEASYNGYGGFAHGASNLLLEDCTTNFNNWRGHWGGQRSWNMGGFKLGAQTIDRVTIRRHTAIGNLCPGVWSDIHPANVRVEDSVMALNDRMGLFFELSNGPHLAERCLIVHNAKEQYVNSIAGVAEIRDSVLYGDSVQNSGRHRLPEPVVRLQWYNRQDTHARQRPLDATVARLTGNVIVGGPRQASLLSFHNGLPRHDPRYERWRLEASGNLFHGPVNEAFTYNTRHWAIHIVQLEALQRQFELSGNDFADPKFVDPDRLDFRVADDSPLAQRRDTLPLKQLDARWLEKAAAFFDWAGHEGPTVLRVRQTYEQRDW
jgi:hypothetical protein